MIGVGSSSGSSGGSACVGTSSRSGRTYLRLPAVEGDLPLPQEGLSCSFLGSNRMGFSTSHCLLHDAIGAHALISGGKDGNVYGLTQKALQKGKRASLLAPARYAGSRGRKAPIWVTAGAVHPYLPLCAIGYRDGLCKIFSTDSARWEEVAHARLQGTGAGKAANGSRIHALEFALDCEGEASLVVGMAGKIASHAIGPVYENWLVGEADYADSCELNDWSWSHLKDKNAWVTDLHALGQGRFVAAEGNALSVRESTFDHPERFELSATMPLAKGQKLNTTVGWNEEWKRTCPEELAKLEAQAGYGSKLHVMQYSAAEQCCVTRIDGSVQIFDLESAASVWHAPRVGRWKWRSFDDEGAERPTRTSWGVDELEGRILAVGTDGSGVAYMDPRSSVAPVGFLDTGGDRASTLLSYPRDHALLVHVAKTISSKEERRSAFLYQIDVRKGTK